MSDFIDHINIENFKSIKSCFIGDCKRINLFIGRPNVGKSNILEALSLFSIPFLREIPSKKLSTLIRLEHVAELFHNGNTKDHIVVFTNTEFCSLDHRRGGLICDISFRLFDINYIFLIDERLNVKSTNQFNRFESPVKLYNYKKDIVYKKGHSKYLTPPSGYNLFSIIENDSVLQQEVRDLFKEHKLDIAFDDTSQTLKVTPKYSDHLFLIPYNSTADTLRRTIFYKTAIASNDDSILLFEEPEAHSFPLYLTHLTQEIIYKKSNQYFITTHSPVILNNLLENGRDELAVFIVYFEDHQTKVRKLTEEELHAVFQNGIDLFTNSESFI